jgi:hypothetical protein
MSKFNVGDLVEFKEVYNEKYSGVFSIVKTFNDSGLEWCDVESLSTAKKFPGVAEEELKPYVKPKPAVMNGITLQSLFNLFDREQMVELEVRHSTSVREVINDISTYPEYQLWRLMVVHSVIIINHHVIDKGDIRLATLKLYLYDKEG